MESILLFSSFHYVFVADTNLTEWLNSDTTYAPNDAADSET